MSFISVAFVERRSGRGMSVACRARRRSAGRYREPRRGAACHGRGLRRARAARRLHRPDLRHAAALAGRVRPRLRRARPVAHAATPAPWRACRFPSALLAGAARRAAGAGASAPRSPGSAICSLAPASALCDAGARAADRRARLEHAASARLGAGGARLRRPALAEGARHLQFRRRSRQDGGAGRRLAAARGRCRGSRCSRCSARSGLRSRPRSSC